MATFPTYPATTLEQGVDLVIFSSNQVHDIINGDATETVETETGIIPTLRKALVDNFYFKNPVAWAAGSNETVFNQLRYFENGILSAYYYAPTATATNPVPMQSTPAGDSNWVLYSVKTEQLPSEVYPWYYKDATGLETTISPPYVFDNAIVTINGVLQIEGEAFTIEDSKIILAEPLGIDPSTGLPNKFFAYIGKTTASTSYVEKSLLADRNGSSMVGLPTGGTVQQAQFYVTPEQFGAKGDGKTDDTTAITRMLAYANTNNISIQADKTYLISSLLNLSGVRWVGGTLKGLGGTQINATSVSFQRVTFDGCYIKMQGGDCRFYHNIFKNQTSVAAFLMQSMTIPGSIDFCYNEMFGCKYAVLQQGTGEKMLFARFAYNYIHDIKGDAIELNVVNGHYPNGLIIDSNHIANVDSTDQGPNWGIGIGIAGAGPYGIDAAESQYVSNFRIRGNRVYNARQCLHVEMGRDFTIENNEVYPSSAVSTNTGLTSAGIALYGCEDFTIDGLTGRRLTKDTDRMIYISWGVNQGTYAGPPVNFTIKNLDIPEDAVEVYTTGSDAWENITVVSDIICKRMLWRGLPSSSIFRGIRAKSLDFIGRHAWNEGPGGDLYARSKFTYTNWVDCVVLDNYTANVSITKLYVDRIDQAGNNFGIATDIDGTGHRGPVVTPVAEQYILDSDQIPGGREFAKGTILWKQSGGKFVVTKAGAYITSSGTYADQLKSAPAGQTYIQSNMLNWATGTGAKSSGTRIVIPGAGAGGVDLTTTITRATYTLNGLYTVDIADALVTAIPQGTIIRALYPIEYKELA